MFDLEDAVAITMIVLGIIVPVGLACAAITLALLVLIPRLIGI